MRIILNGRACEFTVKRTISYEEIAVLVGEHQPSVTYRFQSTGAGGILTKGDRIALAPDLVINACSTGNA